MTTDCMRSTPDNEHRLMTQENSHYQGTLESLVDRKSGMEDDEDKEKKVCAENHDGGHLKKPRRKDTPILHCPSHIPGVRLLKAEKQMVHVEDEEKEDV